MDFLKGYGITHIDGEYLVDVTRVGFPHYQRGGVWYEVVLNKSMGTSKYYQSAMGVVTEARRTYIRLRHPLMVEVYPDTGEASYPKYAYRHIQEQYGEFDLLLQDLKDEGMDIEEAFALIEFNMATELKAQGYDGVIFYVNTQKVCERAAYFFGGISKPTCCYPVDKVYPVRFHFQICGSGNLALQVFKFD